MPESISPAELIDRLGQGRAPLVVSVTRRARYEKESCRIPGTLWRDHMKTDEWGPELARLGSLVVYCAEGHNVSQLAASRLRVAGIGARHLEGGIAAWEAAGGPVIRRHGPGVPFALEQPTIWVTRRRPKVDRIACPWLIRRFIDPLAEFHFVDPEWVTDIADELGGQPFDIGGVHYSHRGETCTFDTMLDEFGLDVPALRRLALIVRGADTARPDLVPEAAGLLAMSLGLSAIEDDDLVQLEKGMHFYDALYGWLIKASGETHNWPVAKVS